MDTAAVDRPQTVSSYTWRREQQRFLPNFHLIRLYTSGNPWLGGSSWQPRGAPGLHPPSVWGEQTLPSAFRGLEGNVTGLKSVLLLWLGRARALSSSAALGQISSGQRKPPCEMGLATALLHFHPCCSGWIPKDAFSASNDVGFGRIGLSGRAGEPQDQRLTGTVGPVPWLLYQHGCLQSLVLSKVTARLKPWVSYSMTINMQCLCGAL